MSRFRVFKNFNKEPLNLRHFRKRIDAQTAEKLQQKGRVGQLLTALARYRCIKTKEVLESLEVFSCIHKRLKNQKIADLCCGHGLTGILFALFNPEVAEVVLLDLKETPSARTVYNVLLDAFPELQGRIHRMTMNLCDFGDRLDSEFGLLAIHACGSRTDQCLDLAVKRGCPIAVMPCCYTGTGKSEPSAIRKSLGVSTAADIGRTYRLEAQDYKVEWDSIPESITPMNRVIIAKPS